jgi:hypothetical protein
LTERKLCKEAHRTTGRVNAILSERNHCNIEGSGKVKECEIRLVAGKTAAGVCLECGQIRTLNCINFGDWTNERPVKPGVGFNCLPDPVQSKAARYGTKNSGERSEGARDKRWQWGWTVGALHWNHRLWHAIR